MFRKIHRNFARVLMTACMIWLALQAFSQDTKKAKYVFFFIGDGMSMAQVNSAEVYMGSLDHSKIATKKLAFTKFPAQGMATTYSANSFITDSAAAATALSTGHKTNSGVICMDPSKKIPYKTLGEYANENGMKVGIVSSVFIDHATPACFYAKAASRGEYTNISEQLTKSGFEYFGGGKMHGDKKGTLLQSLKDQGYTVAVGRKELEKVNAKDGKKLFATDSLLSGAALPFSIDKEEEGLSLAEFTRKGIEVLDNEKGFFMMVEGGKIDWACHANDAASSILDVIAFNDAIKEAVAFYNKHPEDTLIVVTGDHETGGMSIGFAGTKYKTFFQKIQQQTISASSFNGVLGEFKEMHLPEEAKLEDFMPEITKSFGLTYLSASKKEYYETLAKKGDKEAQLKLDLNLNDYEYGELKKAFAQSMLGYKERSKDQGTYLIYGGYEPLMVSATHLLNQKAGIGWTTYSHTGIPVPTFAQGEQATLFNGYYDNTDIPKKIIQAFGQTWKP